MASMKRIQNYTPQTFKNKQPPSLKRKRQQRNTACGLCRQRKVACDRERPCGNCISLRCRDQCSYNQAVSGDDTSKDNGVPLEFAHGFENELQSSDGKLDRLEYRMNQCEEGLHVIRQQNAVPIYEAATHESNATLDSQRINPFADNEVDPYKCKEGSFYIGQHSWTKPFSEDMAYFWQGPFKDQFAQLHSVMGHFDLDRRKNLWSFAMASNLTTKPEADLLALLPEPNLCDQAVSRFLQTLNCIFPVVDTALLSREIFAFREQTTTTSAAWLALYVGIIALGLQLPQVPPQNCERLPQGRSRGKAMMTSVVKYAIHVAQSARRPSNATFQSVLLAVLQGILDSDWVDGNDLTSGLLGMLNRMSSTMGLHRDPSVLTGLNKALLPEEADLRRRLFWTMTNLDMQHSIQTGMPFRYSEHDHDVYEPHKAGLVWSENFFFSTRANSLCAEVLRLAHSHRATVHASLIQDLQQRLSRFESDVRSANISVLYFSTNMTERITVAIQRATLLCIANRLRIIMHWPFIKSLDSALRASAEAECLHSARLIVRDFSEILHLVAAIDETSRDLWTHLAASCFRCMYFHACSTALRILRLSVGWDTARISEMRSENIFTELEIFFKKIDDTVSISTELAKHQLFLWAEYRSVEATYHARSNSEGLIEAVDEERLIVSVTQNAMNTSFTMILAELEKTRSSLDPPPNLLPASPEESARDMALTRIGNATDNNLQDTSGQPLDWLFLLDDLASSGTLVDDLAAPWV